jgi:solute carrier family 39 (zinc transporter), member 1/2/3
VLGPTATEEFESEYTGCHKYDTELYCFASDGDEVRVLLDREEDEHEKHDHDHENQHVEEEESEGCHFHAGVE